MKQADVVVGEVYACYIGQVLAKVEVIGKVDTIRYGSRRKRTTFRVRRPGGSPLPKTRSAASLRALKPRETDPRLGAGMGHIADK